MTPEEYTDAYRNLDSRATDRPTDMNEPTVRALLKKIHPEATSLLDIGCGRGYLLSRIAESHPKIKLVGCDVYNHVEVPGVEYRQGTITALPFPDNSFDVVTATCILEHIIDVEKAVAELKRVARKQVVIVVPCQRYYYYTLDMHVHFFPTQSSVEHLMQMPHHRCEKIWGDWLYIGEKK